MVSIIMMVMEGQGLVQGGHHVAIRFVQDVAAVKLVQESHGWLRVWKEHNIQSLFCYTKSFCYTPSIVNIVLICVSA